MTTIWTIGHSTRTVAEFSSLLKDNDVEQVVDIRSTPGSSKFPQFNMEEMKQWLPDFGIKYHHLALLGGRRKAQHISKETNAGWRSTSFKNYADYGLTEPFQDGLDELCALASTHRTAYMCSEAVPWRCHRLLVSNALVMRLVAVEHIINKGSTTTHKMGMYGATPHVVNGHILEYPRVDTLI